MSRRPPRFTMTDVARAIRAAEQAEKGWAVEIALDGTIRLIRAETIAASPRNSQGALIDRAAKVLF